MADEMLDLIGLPEVFCDGFTDFTIIDGILRCVGYRKQYGPNGIERIPLVRLVVSQIGAADARDQTTAVLNSPSGIIAEAEEPVMARSRMS